MELLTMGGSAVLGGVLKLWAQAQEAKQAERTYILQALSAKADLVAQARKYENRGFQLMRGVIAFTAVFFVVAFPKLVAVYAPEVEVFVGYEEFKRGFLFFGGGDRTVFQQLKGLVLTPLDTHLVSAVVGLYFGSVLTKGRG